MDERLDGIVRVLRLDDGSGDHGFKIVYGESEGNSDHRWALKVEHNEEYGNYGEPASWNDVREWQFTGVTLADAVAVAWEHYGSPVLCSMCAGLGEFRREGQPGERVPLREVEREYITHDDRQILTAPCAACKGEGMFVSEVPT